MEVESRAKPRGRSPWTSVVASPPEPIGSSYRSMLTNEAELLPAAIDLVPGGHRAGEGGGRARAQRFDDQGQVAAAELGGAARIAQADRGQLLEENRDVGRLDTGAKDARGFGAIEQLQIERLRARGLAVERLARPERARESQDVRVGVGVDDAAHEGHVNRPLLTGVSERLLRLRDIALEALEADAPEERVLAAVAAVEAADPDRRAPRDQGHRRLGVGEEDLARRIEDAPIVGASLGLPARRRRRASLHRGCRITHLATAGHMDQAPGGTNAPFGAACSKMAIALSLVGEERRHERHGGGYAEGRRKTDPIGPDKADSKQSHASARDDAVGEGDHACGGRQQGDEGTGPEPRLHALLRPATGLDQEIGSGFRSERAVVDANPGDALQRLLVLDTGVYETSDSEDAENEHCWQQCKGERPEHFPGPRRESHRNERARERVDVQRSPSGRFSDRCARIRLEHVVFGDQRRHKCRVPFLFVHQVVSPPLTKTSSTAVSPTRRSESGSRRYRGRRTAAGPDPRW